MITEKELIEAIAECQGQRNPNASTCIKLASFLTILDHMQADKKEPVQTYSYASGDTSIDYQSGTEFSDAIYGMDTYKIFEIMDELMTTLSVVNPSLYNGVMRRIAE